MKTQKYPTDPQALARKSRQQEEKQEKCPHPLIKIHLLALTAQEYSNGPFTPLQHDQTHTYHPHAVYAECRVCHFHRTYDPQRLPKWVQAHMETIRGIQKQEKLEGLLEELRQVQGPLDLTFLDELLDAGVDVSLLVGSMADWHGTIAPITTLKTGKLVIQVPLTCIYCEQNTTQVYVGSGLHNGAFCYVFDEEGNYQANLRDQDYVCESEACQERSRITQERLQAMRQSNDPYLLHSREEVKRWMQDMISGNDTPMTHHFLHPERSTWTVWQLAQAANACFDFTSGDAEPQIVELAREVLGPEAPEGSPDE